MSTTPDKLVDRYLKHLEVELDDVPRDRRREIVDEIAGHIAEARAGLDHETEADVRNILEGLGDPAEIAEDARERFDVRPVAAAPPSKPGWIEIGALVMLLIGGLVIPIFGWFIGVVLLWVSNAWNVRDKLIGTIFVPGGLGLALGQPYGWRRRLDVRVRPNDRREPLHSSGRLRLDGPRRPEDPRGRGNHRRTDHHDHVSRLSLTPAATRCDSLRGAAIPP
jgi:hypothetical protein